MTKMVRRVSLVFLMGLCAASWGMSSPREDLTLVVVPERYSVIQVAFDVVEKRPVVLVSYRGGPDGESVLHAWNGRQWIHLSAREFSEGSFLKVLPRRAVLVGDDNLLPDDVKTGAAWAPQVWQVPSIQTDGLVNSFGKIFNFRRSEWQWFAARYKLDLEDLNEDLRKDSWYYHPYIDDRAVPKGTAQAMPETTQNVAPMPELDVEEVALETLPEAAPAIEEDVSMGMGIEPIEDVQLPK